MSAGRKFLSFVSGSLLGAAIGTAAAVLFAPRSGKELQGKLVDQWREIQLAGAEAKASKEDELIRKFRDEVDDPTALRDEEAKLRVEAAQAMAAIGLGLNAPGALASQETHLRQAPPSNGSRPA